MNAKAKVAIERFDNEVKKFQELRKKVTDRKTLKFIDEEIAYYKEYSFKKLLWNV